MHSGGPDVVLIELGTPEAGQGLVDQARASWPTRLVSNGPKTTLVEVRVGRDRRALRRLMNLVWPWLGRVPSLVATVEIAGERYGLITSSPSRRHA